MTAGLPPCVVLGGGVGTRMRPVTYRLPKPLILVDDEPFAVHQLRWLASCGVTDVVYSIGYLGHMIRDALGSRHDLGCAVTFVDEGAELRGTGGAVRLAVDECGVDDAFFVLYGDSYLRVDLHAVMEQFTRSRADALMTVFRNDGAWDTSNVVFDGSMVVRYDKHEPDPRAAGMHHIDYGLSVLRAETARTRIPADAPSDLADLFATLSAEHELAGYEAHDRFFEIGSPAGLDDLRRYLDAAS